MTEQHIDERAHSAATPAQVYALLVDGASWPTWSPLGSFALEREGPTGGESLGAVRRFTTGRRTTREEIVELVPDRRFSYALLSGLPLVGYRGDVDLTPAPGGGTDIRWHSTFRPQRAGTGALYRIGLGRFIRRTVRGLAAAAPTR